jgi:hypothetical protein
MFSSLVIAVIFGGTLGFLLSWCNIKVDNVRFWVSIILLNFIFFWYGDVVAKEKIVLEQQRTTALAKKPGKK